MSRQISLLLHVCLIAVMAISVHAKQTGMETIDFPDGKLVTITSMDDRFASGTNHIMTFYWIEREGAHNVWRPVVIKWRVPKSQEFHVLTTEGSEIQIADWALARKNNKVILIGAHKEPKEDQSIYDETSVRITYFSLEKGGDYEARRYFNEFKSTLTRQVYADAASALKIAARGGM